MLGQLSKLVFFPDRLIAASLPSGGWLRYQIAVAQPQTGRFDSAHLSASRETLGKQVSALALVLVLPPNANTQMDRAKKSVRCIWQVQSVGSDPKGKW
jgi:hypothetical protein